MAVLLLPFLDEHPLILALPRGGVPVAAEVATALKAPLDVLVVRKLGSPWQPELGIGAIGEGDTRVLNHSLIAQLGLTRGDVERIVKVEGAEVQRRLDGYRHGTPPSSVEGRLVIIVDDGIATGFTARAGIEILHQRGASRVILAAPVAPADVIRSLAKIADQVVVLDAPDRFGAIGQLYDDFSQVTDEEVRALLSKKDY